MFKWEISWTFCYKNQYHLHFFALCNVKFYPVTFRVAQFFRTVVLQRCSLLAAVIF